MGAHGGGRPGTAGRPFRPVPARLAVRILLAAVVAFAGATAYGETFSVHLLTDSDDPRAERLVRSELRRATEELNEHGTDTFVIADSPSAPAGAVQAIASSSGGQRSLVLTLNRSDGGSETLVLYGAWDTFLHRSLRQSFRYLAAASRGFPASREASPPALVDSLRLDLVPPPREYPGPPGVHPTDVAVRSDGSVIVAGSVYAVEFDQQRRLAGYPGRSLLAAGVYGAAQSLDVTPAGTIYLRGGTGPYAYRIAPTAVEPDRLRLPLTGPGTIAALTDGSAVVTDSVAPAAVRIEGRRSSAFDLFPHQYSYITTISSAPDGTLWAFDPVERRIHIFAPNGDAVDTIVPQLSAEQASGTIGLAVYDNLDFLLLTRSGLHKFTRTGRPVWRLPDIPGTMSTLNSAAVAVHPSSGAIFVVDTMQRVLLHLFDADAAASSGPDSPLHAHLLETTRGLADEPGNLDLLARRAGLYTEAGATVAAEAAWSDLLDYDPSHEEASAAIEQIALDRLFQEGLRLAEDAQEDLRTFGPETARATYSRSLQLLEQLLARDPFYPDGQETADRIREERSNLGSDTLPEAPVRIIEAEVENLFPSLIGRYQESPVGTIRLENAGDTPATDLQLTVSLPRYSDLPRETVVAESVGPGEHLSVPVYIALNQEVLSLEEDLPVRLQLEVTGRAGGRSFSTRVSAGTTLYRRSAMQWSDTAWLASFVTPNEATVARFALSLGDTADLVDREVLPRPVYRAARVAEALGRFRVYYVEDPDTPISEILGREEVVDTVRVPRTTLLYRAGDCDDTTALTCSLLEASGVGTAFVTTPDHVLMAFDTGEPTVNAWLYEAPDRTVMHHGGTVWIPLETTVLHDGFLEAWRNASRRLTSIAAPDGAAIVPVAKARERFAPLPLPPREPTILPPAGATVARAFSESIAGTERLLYGDAVDQAERRIATLEGRSQVPMLSRLAGLHARFGKVDLALDAVRRGLQIDERSTILRTNLAQLHLMRGEPRPALEELERVLERRPTSIAAKALLARAVMALGDRDRAAVLAAELWESAPELAAQLQLIPDGTATRASDAAAAGDAEGGTGAHAAGAFFLWPTDD